MTFKRIASSLISIIGRFPDQHVVMLGDLVADEFIYGDIGRISREAPVLILKERERRIVPGGGANAVNNLADLGAQVSPAGIVGDDEAGAALLRYFAKKGVPTAGIIRVRDYATPTKSRVLGGLSHWQHQQIVRIDREPSSDNRGVLRKRVTRRAAPLLERGGALLISDYGYGATSATDVSKLRASTGLKIPVIADARYDLGSYRQITAATPNEPEVEAVFGKTVGEDVELLFELGSQMLANQSLEALLITRGRDGMVLFERNRKPVNIPIFGSDQAVDVTGAGDTVVAAFTLALSAGASFVEAAWLANCAGGLVVMKRGTATITARELAEAIRNS